MDALTALGGLPSTSTRHRSGAGRPAASARDVANLRDQLAARAARSRRQRLVAFIGATGIVAAGAGWFGVDEVIKHFDPDHAPRTVQPANWTTQAQVTLASINKQLDTIAQTRVVWDSQISPRYRGTVPAQVSQMLDREALLEQQKAAVESQLATTRQLSQVRGQIAELDRQLAQIESTLNELPPANLSPDQTLVAQALQNRRDLLRQDRQAKLAELTRLQQGVQTAEHAPLPDPADRTTPVTQAVLELDKHGPGRPGPDGPRQPEVLAAGRDDRRDQQTAATPGQLADPRKEPIPDRSNMGPDGKPTDAVTTTVSNVGGAAKHTVDGVGNAVEDTVGEVGHGVSGGGSDTSNGGSRARSGSGSGSGGGHSPSTPSSPTDTVKDIADTAAAPVRDAISQGSSSSSSSSSDPSSSSSRSGTTSSESTSKGRSGGGGGGSSSSTAEQLRMARQVVDSVPGMAYTPADGAISYAEQMYSSGSTSSAPNGSSPSSPSSNSSSTSSDSSSGGGSGSSTGSGA